MANDVQAVRSMSHLGIRPRINCRLPRWRRALLATALIFLPLAEQLSLPAADSEADTATLLSTSPDGAFLLKRRQAESDDRGEAKKSLEIVTSSGKVVYSWVSPLGATTALWSPDGRYLALNDMPGDKGDQLRLFALNAGSASLVPIRDPDGKKLRAEVEARHGSFLSLVDKVSLRALDWRGGRLWCQLDGSFRPKRQPSVYVPFHHLWVFLPNGTNQPLFQQEWTLTDPKEKPVREIER
jgi:hypothetical protein